MSTVSVSGSQSVSQSQSSRSLILSALVTTTRIEEGSRVESRRGAVAVPDRAASAGSSSSTLPSKASLEIADSAAGTAGFQPAFFLKHGHPAVIFDSIIPGSFRPSCDVVRTFSRAGSSIHAKGSRCLYDERRREGAERRKKEDAGKDAGAPSDELTFSFVALAAISPDAVRDALELIDSGYRPPR